MALEAITLAVNIGSSSKKYALYHGDVCALSAHFEKTAQGFVVSYDDNPPRDISDEIFHTAISVLCDYAHATAGIARENIQCVGIRIVAPGTYFQSHHRIDESFLQALLRAEEEDPVHIQPMREEIARVQRELPHSLIVGVSDSAFHVTIPDSARMYAIPSHVAEKGDVFRFGYHGLSIASVVGTLHHVVSGVPERVVVCHLGSGASVSMLYKGASMRTSMGYSPLSGLPMSTRVGDIDVGAVLRLVELYPHLEVKRMLYEESGLKAVSNYSADMRTLLSRMEEGNHDAHNAVSLFVESIVFYIGAYTALLGGIDALVFSGTIGERSAIIRKMVCERLACVGVVIDTQKNNTYTKPGHARIDTGGDVSVWVIPTDEAKTLAREARSFLHTS